MALEDTQQISRIRTLVLGGEDLGTALAARARAALGDVRVFNEYGPTEATVGCMLHEFDERRDLEASVPIGRPAEATRTYVLDAGLNPAPDDVIGDLYVGGPDRLANGYLDQPAATAESFVPDPFVAGARMYRTGDLASVRSDGVLRYHGRADDQTKINGVRVELGEIRRAVMAHPEITACALSFISPAPVDPRRCTDCGLGNDHPEADIDGTGRCRLCRDYAVYRERAAAYFRDMDDLAGLLREAADRRTGPYDCLMLLSGGKDSTYALARLSELTPRILCATLDNGYISEGAKTNIRKVCATLGLDHRFIATPQMREIFADSLARHAHVCNGCFKTIYTRGLKLARDEGIPAIVTGLSRGQLFETRLAPELFSDAITNADAIDRTVMEARRAYHRVPDAAARRLNGNLFADEAIFDEISFIDFYRYCDVPVDEVYRHLAEHVGWLRPADTGRSTNCLINDVGIYVHKRRMGYHNYALPYSWDVRMAHKSREAALEELDDDIDTARVRRILNEVGYPDPPAAERSPQLVCHYSARSPLASRELRRHLAAHLPREMIQAELVPIDRVPLTPNGKIDYAALPDPALVPSDPDATPTPPSTETEAALASIWAEILGRTVGIDDNFFEVGGDSIAAIRIASAASRKGFGVSAVDVLRLQTVAAISAAADQVEVETPARRTRATLDARSAARLAEIFGSRSGG